MIVFVVIFWVVVAALTHSNGYIVEEEVGQRGAVEADIAKKLAQLGQNSKPVRRRNTTWEDVSAAIEDFPFVADVSISVLDHITGARQYLYNKGAYTEHRVEDIASASKWVAGGIILTHVDSGLISLDEPAYDYFSYWTREQSDNRSRVTLRDLLSFTSGFLSGGTPCIGSAVISYLECAEIIYNTAPHACNPGECFDYNSNHLHIAGAIAMVANNNASFSELSQVVFDRLGMADTAWNNPTHPTLAGSLRSNLVDYEKFIRAYQQNQLMSADLVVESEIDETPEGTEFY